METEPAPPAVRATFAGRVEAAATMPCPAGDARCVLATTWASNRPFPRLAGTVVPFALAMDGGDRYRVDALAASASVAVRERRTDGDAVHESGWISPGDAVVVEGILDQRARTIVASRI